jgi:hypothetical protein
MVRYLAPALALIVVAAQDATRWQPEELHLRLLSVESRTRGAGQEIVIRARTVLPDGGAWGEQLRLRAMLRRWKNTFHFPDMLFTYPDVDAQAPVMPATAEVERRGEVQFEIRTAGPGPYLVTVWTDPAIQRDPRALLQLQRVLRLRRDESVPMMRHDWLVEGAAEPVAQLVVWAGEPRQVLVQQVGYVETYWRMLRDARELFDELRRHQEEASAMDDAQWAERAMGYVARLLEIREGFEDNRNKSLLVASYSFLGAVLEDLDVIRQAFNTLAKQPAQGGGEGGGGGGGGGGNPGGLPSSGTPYDASDEFGNPSELPLTKKDLKEGEPMPMASRAYHGALRLDRYERLLAYAPSIAPREALIWYARYAREGTARVQAAYERWRTAPDAEAREGARRQLREVLDEWRDTARRVPEFIRRLSAGVQRESRLWGERGWDRYFEGAAELWDDRRGGGLYQYCDMVEQALNRPPAPDEPDELRRARERLERESERIEQRTSRPLEPQGSAGGAGQEGPRRER